MPGEFFHSPGIPVIGSRFSALSKRDNVGWELDEVYERRAIPLADGTDLPMGTYLKAQAPFTKYIYSIAWNIILKP